MTMVSYFIITLSNNVAYRFKATDMAKIKSKSETVRRTINGGFNVTVGSVVVMFRYTLRVRYVRNPNDSNEGIISELETIYDLNDPNATPSNIFKLTDHLGNVFTKAVIIGDMQMVPRSYDLSGANAAYSVPVTIAVLET